MVLRGNTIFWLTPHITVRNQLWVVIFLSIPFFTYTNALLHRKITCNFRKIMKLRKLMILVTHFYCFNFAEAKKKNHNSLASSEIILLTTSKSVIPIGFKHHPHCSVLIYITFCFPNLCLLCLDAKVSFKLVRQANSAGDKTNILISSVTDTFPTRKSSTEPKISHMLLYIDLHLLSILCQQKYLKRVWRKKVGFLVIPEPLTACHSDYQLPTTQGQASASSPKPKPLAGQIDEVWPTLFQCFSLVRKY